MTLRPRPPSVALTAAELRRTTALTAAELRRTTALIGALNDTLAGERAAVALAALSGALSVVLAELQSRQHCAIGDTLRMIVPLVETNAERLVALVHYGPVGHA